MISSRLFVCFCLAFFCVTCHTPDRSSEKLVIASVKAVEIDSFIVAPLAFSGVGFFNMAQDTILFYDQVFGTVSKFDVDGNYLGRSLGLGEGPKETFSIMHAIDLENGTHLILEKIWAISIYDRYWNRVSRKNIDWNEQLPLEVLENEPSGEMKGIYEIEYMAMPKSFGRSHVLLPITTDHPKFNSYFTEAYYNDSRVFALLDINSGKIERIFGNRSSVYLKHRYIPNFDIVHFDTDDELIYASFEPDSLIYVIDEEGKVQKTFGRAGRSMSTGYSKTNSFEDAEASIVKDRLTFGHYTDVHFVKGLNLVLRSYLPGGNARHGGLQIYQNGTLLGDFNVPKGLRIIGSDKGSLLAEGIISEEKEQLGFYKIRLIR